MKTKLLKDYTIEELKVELKRRAEEKRAKKAEEIKTALICRNCKHRTQHSRGYDLYQCAVRTWGKKIVRNYRVKLSQKACEDFERNENFGNKNQNI